MALLPLSIIELIQLQCAHFTNFSLTNILLWIIMKLSLIACVLATLLSRRDIFIAIIEDEFGVLTFGILSAKENETF